MQGDFTRDTHDPAKHFSRVLIQQGRVPLDADTNEQTAILLHYLQTLAADLIGPYAGPLNDCGFNITADLKKMPKRFKPATGDLLIGAGHYYVDGILCEVAADVLYSAQPDLLNAPLRDGKSSYLVYLDVWERLVTAVEDPALREIALGGADTAARAQVMQQVRLVDIADLKPPLLPLTPETLYKGWNEIVLKWQPAHRGLLAAHAREVEDSALDQPCVIAPSARYRGAENQLYRVEIHRGSGPATFKWSRDNAAVVAPILTLAGPLVTLASWPPDLRLGLEIDDWVEVVDSDLPRLAVPADNPDLFQVREIDPVGQTVTLSGTPTRGGDAAKHPALRRWDQPGAAADGGAIPLTEDPWLDLEDGIQIRFAPATGTDPAPQYRAGDYWLIPARTATGDVDWPGAPAKPTPLPPHGVTHHYAPLALIAADNSVIDCRAMFKPGWAWGLTPPPPPPLPAVTSG